MFIFQIFQGLIVKDGKLFAHAYSGRNEGEQLGKNNPALVQVRNVGPIPPGTYEIAGPPFDSATHGPYCLLLKPKIGTNTFGRTGFMWHGDSIKRPGDASHGCVVSNRYSREMAWESGDRTLKVVGGEDSTDTAPVVIPA